MKILLVTLLLCIASTLADLTEEQKEMLKPYKEACFAELKIDPESIEGLKKEYKEEGKLDLNDKMSCFSACMFKKIGFMTEEGKFDEDMVRALAADQFPEETVEAAIGACKDEAGKNACETAGKLVACLLTQGISMNS